MKPSALLLPSLTATLIAFAAGAGAAEADAIVQAWPARQPQRDPAVEARVEATLKTLTLRQKIGQMVQPEIRAITPDEVREYAIGTVLNGGGGWPGQDRAATPAQWRALSDQYQAAAQQATPGVPLLWGTDAVHGHNNVRGATLFPHNIALGATRDADLVRDIGRATARAVRATGVQWAFAPTLAVVQDVRWGRTYESFGVDPALVKRLGQAAVEGLQDGLKDGRGVLATAKHFVGDGGTRRGIDQGVTNTTPEELAQVHGAGYLGALDAGVLTAMASFSSWTDTAAFVQHGKMHGNKTLLTDVLKQRLAFDGLIVSDWDGIAQVPGCTAESCPEAINAGIDVIMVPYQWKTFHANLQRDVEQGRVPLARIDDAVRRILRVKFSMRVPTDVPATMEALQAPELARRAVRESLVLLKHKPGLLPLKAGARVLVVGTAADSLPHQAGGWSITWQGRDTTNADYPQATSLLAALRQRLGAAQVTFDADGSHSDPQKFDAVIAVLAETPYAEGEGDVRLTENLRFSRRQPQDAAVLQRVAGRGAPVVTLLYSGRPLYVNDLANLSDAFVAAWQPGSEGAGLTDVLVAPATGQWPGFTGRLPFPWPAGPCQFSAHETKPWWPVGGGLSGKETRSDTKRLPEPADPAICPL
ncbi:glycoside hydrolase family 3 protein [Roseateles cellulosilyticus]|uniref:Glycoside hydrolase family 3 protein n=1 Tax=Pelomonas cellulosilytica TaxID=2906762 RepID=A0ABS8XSM0_9BURK|nr:glycoside hydrolase family 3 protein [Pelomonas sp. P8]MCE4553694.1 glycoside hydrolase family 3 protein [Pelomonas sp. P8]